MGSRSTPDPPPSRRAVLAVALAALTVVSAVAAGAVGAGGPSTVQHAAGTPDAPDRVREGGYTAGFASTTSGGPSFPVAPTASSGPSVGVASHGTAGTGPPSFERIHVVFNHTGNNWETINVAWHVTGDAVETNLTYYDVDNQGTRTFLSRRRFNDTTTPDQFGNLSRNATLNQGKQNGNITLVFATRGPLGSQTCELQLSDANQMAGARIDYNRSTGWNYHGDGAFATGACAADEEPALRTSNGSTTFVENGGSVVVDPNLTVSGSDLYAAANASIDVGFEPEADVLTANASGVANVTLVGYNATTGVLRLDGNATADEYEQVLRTVRYNNTARPPDTANRTVTFTVTSTNTTVANGGDVLRYPGTGNYYEHVEAGNVTWQAALAAARNRTYAGLNGTLATVTSAGENDFLATKFRAGGWIGASDDGSEGEWSWETGPEAGTRFFNQTAAHVAFTSPYPDPPAGVPGGGTAVGGRHANWDPRHEPDNKFPFFGGQDHAYLCYGPGSCPDGMWKDAAADSPPFEAEGYFVEYSGDGTPSAETRVAFNLSDARTVVVEPAVNDSSGPTADAGADVTVGEGSSVTLNASGSTAGGTAIVSYEWDVTGNGRTDRTGATNVTTFAEPGTYAVTLTVTDRAANADTDVVNVTVADLTPPVVVLEGPATANRSEPVRFDGSVSRDDTTIASLEWSFGDGSDNVTGTATPTHRYAETGTYAVTLNVTDLAGNSNVTSVDVTITESSAPKLSNLTATNPSGRDVNVTFTSNASLVNVTVEVVDDAGSVVGTLNRSDFAEVDNGDGTFDYTGTTTVASGGTYEVVVRTAEGSSGEDGAADQRAVVNVTADAAAPSVSNVTVTNPTGRDLSISFETNESLSAISVAVNDSSGATVATLSGRTSRTRRPAGT